MKHKDGNELVANSRREFLKKAGKLAAYTPPAMITLMAPGQDAFARSAGCPPGLAQFGCWPPGLDNKP